MRFGRSKDAKADGSKPRRGGPWMPREPPGELSPEAERQAEYDDLAELLAATNAKRAARGKKPLSQNDVQMRNWQDEQRMHRESGPPAEAREDDRDR